jgi:hypothetical protein
MGYMFEGMDPVASTKQKLKNALKGSAMMTREATYLSPKQKLWEIEVIGEFLKYVEDYEVNQAVLAKYKQQYLDEQAQER